MKPPQNQDFLYYLYKNIYDLSYFIIITVIGLNVIFGIIVDTFSELRDSKVWSLTLLQPTSMILR